MTMAEIKQRITPAQWPSWFLAVTSMLSIGWVGGSRLKIGAVLNLTVCSHQPCRQEMKKFIHFKWVLGHEDRSQQLGYSEKLSSSQLYTNSPTDRPICPLLGRFSHVGQWERFVWTRGCFCRPWYIWSSVKVGVKRGCEPDEQSLVHLKMMVWGVTHSELCLSPFSNVKGDRRTHWKLINMIVSKCHPTVICLNSMDTASNY